MDSNAFAVAIGALSGLAVVLTKFIIDYRKQGITSGLNRRDDFTVTFEKMESLLERAERENEKQGEEIRRLLDENAEMKNLLLELRELLSKITIDPDTREKINDIYQKLNKR